MIIMHDVAPVLRHVNLGQVCVISSPRIILSNTVMVCRTTLELLLQMHTYGLSRCLPVLC